MNHADYHAILDQAALLPGPRILQSLRLGDTDEAHVRALLDAMRPAPFSHWLDVGCGYGEVARLMKQMRRDLAFTMVNSNKAQLLQAPSAFQHVLSDMETLPLATASYDGAMYLYSFCHATDPLQALREAARVVRPGGSLFVFDHARLWGDNDEARRRLCCTFYPAEALRSLASQVGWRTLSMTHPMAQEAPFMCDFPPDETEMWKRVFAALVPFLWRAERR